MQSLDLSINIFYNAQFLLLTWMGVPVMMNEYKTHTRKEDRQLGSTPIPPHTLYTTCPQ